MFDELKVEVGEDAFNEIKQALLRIDYEKIPPSTSVVFRGDYRSRKPTKTSPTDTDGATPEVSKSKELDEERR
tara:strand:+ start:757 stop:975 length:219 start_codon:yes stop_codon:yes gene_type:complete